MKMQTNVYAPISAKVIERVVQVGETVDAKDLLILSAGHLDEAFSSGANLFPELALAALRGDHRNSQFHVSWHRRDFDNPSRIWRLLSQHSRTDSSRAAATEWH